MQAIQEMKRVTIGAAQRGLSALIGSVRYGGAVVVITSHGHAACAVVPLAVLEKLERAANAAAPTEDGKR